MSRFRALLHQHTHTHAHSSISTRHTLPGTVLRVTVRTITFVHRRIFSLFFKECMNKGSLEKVTKFKFTSKFLVFEEPVLNSLSLSLCQTDVFKLSFYVGFKLDATFRNC